MSTNKQQVSVTVGGQEYLVEIQDLAASPILATVGEQTFEVSINETVVVEPVVQEPPRPVVVQAAPVAPRPAKPSPETDFGGNNVVAPMPGDIIDVYVQPGDQVSTGQELCSLEAMKMKNAIRSAREGVVGDVHVARGQAVSYGEVLVTFK